MRATVSNAMIAIMFLMAATTNTSSALPLQNLAEMQVGPELLGPTHGIRNRGVAKYKKDTEDTSTCTADMPDCDEATYP